MNQYNINMEAHLWKRDNGTYYAVWSDGKGKTRQKSLKTGDLRQAKRRLTGHNRDLRAGKITPIQPRITSTLGDFRLRLLEHLEKEVARDEIRVSTYNLTDVALKKAIDAWGADKNLLRITQADLEQYQNHIHDAGALAKTTVNKNFRMLKAALKRGQQWGVVCRDLPFPKQWRTVEEIRYFHKKELMVLLAHIDDQEFRDICVLSAYSGLRSGEIIRLRATDIDNPDGFIRISSEQKNRQESRIPINQHMRGIFDRYPQQVGRVFRFKTPDQISRLMKRYLTTAGISGKRFHDLRHTYGAHLIMAGTDIRIVQQLMRHKSIESTMVYTRLFPADLVGPSNALDYGIATG